MVKIADSFRLCAFLGTTIVGRLRRLAPPSQNRRQSQALGTFCALHTSKLQDVAGFLHPHDENCRQSQALWTPVHENCGNASGCLHPRHEIAYSLRLWQRSVLSAHQNFGASQALCTPMMIVADSLRLCAPPSTKIGGRLRLRAAPC